MTIRTPAGRTYMSKDQALSPSEFKQQLAEAIPHLRAFGRSLSGDRDLADDLVQDTLLKAWAARDRDGRIGRAIGPLSYGIGG